jgi:hypothetical protein
VSKKKRGATGQTIGAIIVGFDQQIFRTMPPAQELIAKAKPVRGVSGQAPGFEVVFPDDVATDAGEAAADGEVAVDREPEPEPEPDA